MCGIIAVYKHKNASSMVQSGLIRMHARGPDASGQIDTDDYSIGHCRLGIMDPKSGAQPFKTDRGTILSINGEIYNYQILNTIHTGTVQTRSDCEVVAHLYDHFNEIMPDKREEWLSKFINMLDGVYSFVLTDSEGRTLVARDPIGVTPLYMGRWVKKPGIAFASELKALTGHMTDYVETFEPGHYFDSHSNKTYKMDFRNDILTMDNFKPGEGNLGVSLDNILTRAVHKRLMSDVPWGILLSGGLDSSIIAALAVKERGGDPSWINTFSCGFEGSPDMKYAREMAEHLGTLHHELILDPEELFNNIHKTVWALETYDVTTIRAGTPMMYLAEYISKKGYKMVLSGEGSDEMFGGYLYFKNAPNEKEFQAETIRKLRQLHSYDCLRANKAMAAFGVECRVPFLDLNVIEHVVAMKPELKMCKDVPEKNILREKFKHLLPESIYKRQKEQFSDGVGYNWIDMLKERFDKMVSPQLWEKRKQMFPVNTPQTKEAFYYRHRFEKAYHTAGAVLTVPHGDTCACSSAVAARWKGNEVNDASGRSVKGHINTNVV